MVDIADVKELTGGAANLPPQGLGLIGTHAVPLLSATRCGQQPGIVLTSGLRKVKGIQHRAFPVPTWKVPAFQPANENDACYGRHSMPIMLAP